MGKRLLVIQHQEFIEWLYRLRSREDITDAAIGELRQLANQLKIHNLSSCKRLIAALVTAF